MESIAKPILLADRIWIALALLQQEFPFREDFTKDEIRRKMRDLNLMADLNSASVAAHLKEHLVANVPPSSGKYRMLFETQPGHLRLFRPGDAVDPRRVSRRPTKQCPNREDIPKEYQPLLDWYAGMCDKQLQSPRVVNYDDDPLIKLIGSGKHIWADEHADEYVENLRKEDV